nr:MAG TPA: hypothetical protein [Caudoviricetes sp.]
MQYTVYCQRILERFTMVKGYLVNYTGLLKVYLELIRLYQ